MDVARRARRGRALLWSGVAVVALVGCWPAPGAGPDRTAHNPFETEISPATVGSLQRQWSTRLTTATAGPMAVVGDAVYASDASTVHRLDAATGARRWEASLDPPPPGASYPSYRMGSPIVVGDRVLIGWGGPTGPGVDNGHWVTQWLDPATGTVLDEGPPGGQLAGVRGDKILSTRETPVPSSPAPLATLVVADRDGTSWRGLVGTADVTLGREHVYATDGTSVSAYPVDGGESDCGPSPELPFACPVWRTPIEGASNEPVLGDGGATVYVTTDGGSASRAMLHALDAATGRVRWSADLGARSAFTPALADGRLYIPGGNGRLVVVDAGGCGEAICQPLWSDHVGWAMSQQPAVAGGVVFVTAYDSLSGHVYAFDAAGCGEPICSHLWRDWTYSEITSPPVVSGGRLFVSSGQDVIAYGPAEGQDDQAGQADQRASRR